MRVIASLLLASSLAFAQAASAPGKVVTYKLALYNASHHRALKVYVGADGMPAHDVLNHGPIDSRSFRREKLAAPAGSCILVVSIEFENAGMPDAPRAINACGRKMLDLVLLAPDEALDLRARSIKPTSL